MDYQILVKLSKAEPGHAWEVGEIVTDEQLQADGVTDVKKLIDIGLIKKAKVKKDEQISIK